MVMLASGTEDARGYKQWEAIGRQVSKSAKAMYIFGPCTQKKIVKDNESGKEIEKTVLSGFRTIPVFRYEDTEGNPLPKIDYSPPELPPLFGLAEKFGIKIKYQSFSGGAYGTFYPGGNEIALHSHDANVFFHELAHAVHHTFNPLKLGQHANQEIVAEVVACALCEIYGYKGYIWHGYKYVKQYASQDTRQAIKAVMGVLKEVEKVLKLILDTEEKEKKIA
ncbi:MAG: ArdC-like ssDNA-binding domain-containing protein [Peptococcaceae bacterium]